MKLKLKTLLALILSVWLVGCVKDNSMKQAKLLVKLSKACDGEILTTLRTGQGGYIEVTCKGQFNNMTTAN